ncbi:hypothetical protein [Vagococcus fluvialis]|uniref:hypothetical protein n=1 Tax=Vagococcus fluvialis TaxID=2738 RepID=UPI001D0B4058|nr:hypothetical protein [Vagococcus fluvialis]UDM72670.1 hypothetical protein K5L00_14880 [Vagococcus fluvialis]UDM78393.1 hypothetical protein K5K98_15085 [Vagococcus fluvialis]UDM83945.1 hypothetical protein K5K96_14905 [Vagococcus fluvialis]
MEIKIRDLVVKYGAPFVDRFDDFSEDSDKTLLFEKVLNKIDWDVPVVKISEILIDELSVFMTSFVPKGKYDLDTIEESFRNMVDMASFAEYNSSLNKDDLMNRINWEEVFAELG